MGTVACCKKPNELIDDKDVFRKSTMKKTMNLQVDQIEQQNPFQKVVSRQKNFINQENSNNLLDLEETKNSNNICNNIPNNIQYIQKNPIEHQSTNGPSDNLRKKRYNNIGINNNNIMNNNINKNIHNINNQIDIKIYSEIQNKDNNSTDNTLREKGPVDKINSRNNNDDNTLKKENIDLHPIKEIISTDINSNINNNINSNILSDREPLNSDRHPSDSQKILEKNTGEIIREKSNINTQIEKEQNLNQQSDINNNDLENQFITEDITQEEKKPQDQLRPEQMNIPENINSNINPNININIRNNDEEPQNSLDNQNINNNNNETNYIPQNIIKNHTKIDSQLPDDEDPKDSNEVNPQQNMNINNQTQDEPKNNENPVEENSQIKEAYIQDPDGQIIPTQQISDSEIAYLYQQCLSKGETEPDDDFNPESYKKFYPEDDPFFIFDKGEVSEGQIIASPDDIENLEIYEGEINEQNKKHGFGILTTPEFVRKGTWRNGEFTGWGRESRRNKDVLEGKFIDGLLNGKGIFKNSRNNLYTGNFVNSKREGTGELYTNRIHYIGEFKEDKLDGKGIIEFLKEGHKYEGDFKNNEINGIGIFRWKNGDVYEGEMTDGKMNGHGVYTYANGQIYDGEYVNGIREGKGRIILNNRIVYEGDFVGGHRYEKGRITSSNRNTNNGNVDNNEEENN